MKFRVFSITVFAVGLLCLAMTFVINGARGRAPANPEFDAATTLVTDQSFDDVVLASKKPVVVDFYGDYCVVCRQLEPELVTLAKEYSEAAVFTRVNVQDAPELVKQYDVQQVPTLMVMHQGEVLFQDAGLGALPSIQAVLERARGEELE